jgi:hypothetical protein
MEFGGAGNTLVLRQNGEFELVQCKFDLVTRTIFHFRMSTIVNT